MIPSTLSEKKTDWLHKKPTHLQFFLFPRDFGAEVSAPFPSWALLSPWFSQPSCLGTVYLFSFPLTVKGQLCHIRYSVGDCLGRRFFFAESRSVFPKSWPRGQRQVSPFFLFSEKVLGHVFFWRGGNLEIKNIRILSGLNRKLAFELDSIYAYNYVYIIYIYLY